MTATKPTTMTEEQFDAWLIRERIVEQYGATVIEEWRLLAALGRATGADEEAEARRKLEEFNRGKPKS